MGKISPVSAKYIVHASIEIDGVVDRPDVIGAIFGQTEGLLGADLELRELQRSGRIGRIEVNVDTRTGKTKGELIVPSSLDKSETAIIAAAFEIIQRIGPCNAKITVGKIEDVRVSKRKFVVDRAKQLLRSLIDSSMPDSQELADEVAYSVRVMEIQEYGRDRLPAGPMIDESEEIIVVEGRADVLNLLKHGIKNSIAMNGSVVPQTIIELSKKKEIIMFVDGDRGGILNVKEMLQVASLDYVSRAPDGKEVEELTKKEIHQALRGRVSAEQARLEIERAGSEKGKIRNELPVQKKDGRDFRERERVQRTFYKKVSLKDNEKEKFREMLESLIGTRGAYILNTELSILGKVPVTELVPTVKTLGSGVYALVFDGTVEKDIVDAAEKLKIQHLVGMDTSVNPHATRVNVFTEEQLA